MTKQNQQHDNANVGTRPNGIKFMPSLTKRRIHLPEYADNIVKDIEVVTFVYADMHVSLKMILNEPVNQKFVHAFKSKIELAKMIAKIDYEDPSDMNGYNLSLA